MVVMIDAHHPLVWRGGGEGEAQGVHQRDRLQRARGRADNLGEDMN